MSENGVFPQITILIRPIMIYPWDILGVSYFRTNSQVPRFPRFLFSLHLPSATVDPLLGRWRRSSSNVGKTWTSESSPCPPGLWISVTSGLGDISSLVGFTD